LKIYLLLYSLLGSANPGKGGTGKIREEKNKIAPRFCG
jgi:hypothetical protein